MKQSKTPVISFSPVVLPVTGRHVDLEIKVSAPASGNNLPPDRKSKGAVIDEPGLDKRNSVSIRI